MNIHDFPNYLIFDDGKVFSKNSNKFLKPGKGRGGYHYVILYKDGNAKTVRIHRLIAIHYIPNPDNLPEVDHINRDKSYNTVQNLRWSSRIDNNNNKGMFKTNTSGHIGISYHKTRNRWKYEKSYHNKRIQIYFKTKTQALCYKYIILLKIKSGIF
jgi:hypothetical protein